MVGVFYHSRQGVVLDPPVLAQLRFRPGRTLDGFSQPVVQRSYSGIRRTLPALLTAGFLGRLFLGCLPEREPDQVVFDLLCQLFEALDLGVEPRACGLWGQERLLRALGLTPHLTDCVRCGEGRVSGFSPSDGGVLCVDCFRGDGPAVSDDDRDFFRVLQVRSLLEVSEFAPSASSVRAAGLVFKSQFQTHLDLGSHFFKRVLPPSKG